MEERDRNDHRHSEPEVTTRVTAPLARSLRDSRASLTYRWLDRIQERVQLEAGEVFPSDQLLDHVPLLLEAVADFMENPAEEGTAADTVMTKAAELGEMRFDQGFSTYQVLKEFEILGGVILSHLRSRVTELGFTPEPDDIVLMSHRVHRALAKVQQATAARHIALLEEQRHDLDQRLRLVAGMLGALEDRITEAGAPGSEGGAAPWLAGRVDDLRRLADTGLSSRRRGVPLTGVVREAVRRVRPIAARSDLEVGISDPLPSVEVPDAQVEHCLVVYLTNALRHCGEAEGRCSVAVSASIEPEGVVVVRVRNTGQVVEAVDDITRLAPGGGHTEGERGAGLRFARDIIASLGGRTWAEPASDPPGAIFALALPSRRSDDEEPAGPGDDGDDGASSG